MTLRENELVNEEIMIIRKLFPFFEIVWHN